MIYLARTTVSARVFNTALMSIVKELVVKNMYEAVSHDSQCDYMYVDQYISAAKRLLTKYSLSYLTTSLDQIEQLNAQIAFWQSQIERLQKGLPINYQTYATPEEEIKDLEEKIAEAQKEIENIITINGTADESTRASMQCIVDYNEINDYYLMLSGHPSVTSTTDASVMVYNEDFDQIMPIDTQPYAYRNRWLRSPEGIQFLSDHKNDSQYKYLNFMTNKKIYPFSSRMAGRFEILYCPPSDPTVLADDFIQIYQFSLDYTIRVFYTEGYRRTEPKIYEGFIGMAILFMAIAEMHWKYLDADISRDFYDLDSLKIVYEAYSVPFYDIIPLKFHKKIVKNINRLIACKGSNKVFMDLCDIFDYDILGIYQYYLFKERKIDKDNNPVVVWKTTDGSGEIKYDDEGNPTNLPLDPDTGKPIQEPDLQAMFDIYFVRANINSERFTQIIDPNNKVTYDSIVNNDSYWFQFDKDTIDTIYQKQYNYIETKYIGVQLMFQMTDLLWESAYFMGMLRDNRSKISGNQFQISHDRLGINVPLFDMLIYIIALICKKRGYDGRIRGLFYKVDDDGNYLNSEGNITTNPDEYVALPSIASRILGFNFKGLMTNLTKLRDIYRQGISNREVTMQGHHIKKDFLPGEEFHPFDLAVGNDTYHGNDIPDWIKKNEGFVRSEACQNLIGRIFASKENSTPEAETAYFANLNIENLDDVSRAFKSMKHMKEEIDTLLVNTHDLAEYNALKDLQRLLYTTEIIEQVFEDDMTGELAISYYSLLESLNPQLANRYDDEDIDIDDELDYCLLQLQNLCDELRYMIYIDELDIDVITEYLYKMLRFFKSAKADLTDFNIIFYISDRAENLLKFLEKMDHIKSQIWIDEPFKDLYDHIESIMAQNKIYDKSWIFRWTMECINSLSSKIITIKDGWEINVFMKYIPLSSTEENPFNIDTLHEPRNENYIVQYIEKTDNIPQEFFDDELNADRMTRPLQITNKVLDNGDIEQTIYVIPRKYTRIYHDGAWSEFIKSNMEASIILTDRIGEWRTPIVQKGQYLLDSIGNGGFFDNIQSIINSDVMKTGLFLSDKLIKVIG